jgi:hypothetical protein
VDRGPGREAIDVLDLAAGASVTCHAGDWARSIAVPGLAVDVARLLEV